MVALSSLADILLWRHEHALLVTWREQFDAHVERGLDSLRLADSEDACLLEGLQRLPAAARRRLLRAPHVVAAIVGHRRDGRVLDVGFLAEALLAELAAVGLVRDLPTPVWTARGAVAGAEAVVPGTAIMLDDRSPQRFPYEVSPLPLALLDESDRVATAAKVSLALAGLARACPPAHTFVAGALEQIAVRTDPADPAGFHSSSFSQYMGLALLINPHLEEIDVPRMADALVHEAIHSVLFRYEEMEAEFVRSGDGSPVRIESPWTGASLELRVYVHACVVWYGLFWLWQEAAGREVFGPGRCRALAERACRGFAARPVALRLATVRDRLSPAILELLDEIELRMVTT